MLQAFSVFRGAFRVFRAVGKSSEGGDMTEAMEKRPDIREQVGSAFHATHLVMCAGAETPLLRVAALGAASAAIRCGADRQDLPIAAMQRDVLERSVGMRSLMMRPPQFQPDPRDVLSSELAPMLWHIRYGAQHNLVPKAVDLFAQWMTYRRTFSEFTTPDQVRVLLAFSGRVLHEWLSDQCQACGGCGKLERTREGNMVRPRGSMQRNAVFRVCNACHGTGRASVRPVERTRQLGISMREYETQRWEQRFTSALTWLNQFLDKRLTKPLTAELERRKRRPTR